MDIYIFMDIYILDIYKRFTVKEPLILLFLVYLVLLSILQLIHVIFVIGRVFVYVELSNTI